jgi:PAS domain S-box-containing protein
MKTDNELNFSIDVNENGIQFNDIFNIEDIQRMQDLFCDATGVSSIITYPNGSPITRPSNFCSLCTIVRNTEKGLANCIKSDALNCCGISTEMQFQPCLSAGLWDTGAKISVNEIHIANWLIGQVRNEETDVRKIIEYGKEIGANEVEYLEALNLVPLMSKDQFHKIFEMMFVIANELSEKAYTNLLLKKQIDESEKVNELLQKNERTLSITLHSIGDGVISTNKDGSIVNMNPVAEAMCGWKLSEAFGKQLAEVFSIINAKTRLPVENPVKKVLEKGKIIGLANHTVLISRDGTEYHIADSAAPIKNIDKMITGVVLVFSDVTEKYLADKKLEESERSKSVLLSNIPGIAYRCKFDPQWTMEFVSEGFSALTGYQTEDIINNKIISFNDIILPEYREHLWNVWEKAVQYHQKICEEYRILTADNQIKWVWEQGIPIYDERGKVKVLEGLIIDITDRKCIEEKLRDSEQYLQQSQAIARLGTYTFDIIHNNWISSGLLDSLFGISNHHDKSLTGWISIIHPEWQEYMTDYFVNEVIGKRRKFDKEYKIIRKNDFQERWVHGIGELVFDETNRPIKMNGIIQDITDKKLATEELRESEEKYRNIFDNVQDVFYQVDMKGNLTEVSTSINQIAGYKRDEVIGRPIEMLYVNAYERKVAFDMLIKNKQVRDYEIDLMAKNGTIRHASLNAKLIYDSAGNPHHIDGFIRDVTERKLAQNALQESEKKFHDYIEFAPLGVLVANESGKFIEVNSAASNITGYGKDELITMNQVDLVAKDSTDSYFNHFNTAVKRGFATDEFGMVRKDKSMGYISVDTAKLTDKLHLAFIADITDRRNAELKLKENEEFLMETQMIANLGNCIVDFTTGTWKSSEIMNSIIGIDHEFDKTFQSFAAIIHPDWKKEVDNHFLHDVIENRTKFNIKFKIIRPVDLLERWIHAIGELKFDADNKPLKLVATVQDITERKLSAEALRLSEQLYRSILNASPDAIVVVEISGKIRMVSPTALTMYGCTGYDQLIGHNMFDFIDPDDRDRALSNNLLMIDGLKATTEYRIVKNDGTPFFAEVNGEILWNSENEPNGLIFIIRDITERKKGEVALKNSQIELKQFASHLQNVREEEKIQLAREIHDELGQILIAIKIDLGMMKQKVLKSIKTVDAENILTNFDNLFGLVDNTLNTTRRIMTDLRPEVLFLVGFVEAVKLYINNFKERYQIICIFDNSVSGLKLSSQQSVALYRIVQESLTNIVKHSKATKVKISIALRENKLGLEITDNGTGFKTSQKSKANSFGLLGMKERVYLLEGVLQISSQQGEGTTVKVEIPYQTQTKINV